MILSGSSALKYWYGDEFKRIPKDIDVIVDKNYECKDKPDNVELLENPIIYNLYKNRPIKVVFPQDLCTLKASHLCWNINWEKHMFDVQFLIKKGCKIDLKLFNELYSYWNEYHSNNKRSDLKMSINYNESEHDIIHTYLNPTPIYTKVLKDNCEVELDENKFNILSFEDKLNFVREEVMVMAWERYKPLGFQHAYSKMLKKFIIGHAPIWSVIFIIENYIELHKSKINYFKIIEDGINISKNIK